MAAERELQNAKAVYKTLCKALDDQDWKYEKDDEDLTLHFFVTGDDLPMQFFIVIDEERQLFRLLSPLPFTFGGDKRLDGAIATCQTNYALNDGSFDYDCESGKLVFRLTSSFRDSLVSPNAFLHLMHYAFYVVDEYNDKLMMVAKGLLSVEDYIAGL